MTRKTITEEDLGVNIPVTRNNVVVPVSEDMLSFARARAESDASPPDVGRLTFGERLLLTDGTLWSRYIKLEKMILTLFFVKKDMQEACIAVTGTDRLQMPIFRVTVGDKEMSTTFETIVHELWANAQLALKWNDDGGYSFVITKYGAAML